MTNQKAQTHTHTGIRIRTHKKLCQSLHFYSINLCILYIFFYFLIICARNKILHLLLEILHFLFSCFVSPFIDIFCFVWLIIMITFTFANAEGKVRYKLHFTTTKVRSRVLEKRRDIERENLVDCCCLSEFFGLYATEWSKPIAMPTLHTNYLFIQSTLRQDKFWNAPTLILFVLYFCCCFCSVFCLVGAQVSIKALINVNKKTLRFFSVS